MIFSDRGSVIIGGGSPPVLNIPLLSSAASFFAFAFKFFQQAFSCDLSLTSLMPVEPLKRSDR